MNVALVNAYQQFRRHSLIVQKDIFSKKSYQIAANLNYI